MPIPRTQEMAKTQMMYGRTGKYLELVIKVATPGPGSYILPSDFGVLDTSRLQKQELPRITT